MRHPVGRPDQRRPVADLRVGQPDPVGRSAERDVLWQRSRGDTIGGDGPDESVAAAANGSDVALRLSVVTQCPARRFDPARQRRLTDKPAAPHRIEELFFGDDALVVADQVDHHVEHLRLDADDAVAATQFVASGVQHEVVESPDTRHSGCRRPGLRRHWLIVAVKTLVDPASAPPVGGLGGPHQRVAQFAQLACDQHPRRQRWRRPRRRSAPDRPGRTVRRPRRRSAPPRPAGTEVPLTRARCS